MSASVAGDPELSIDTAQPMTLTIHSQVTPFSPWETFLQIFCPVFMNQKETVSKCHEGL